ncbi:HDOD domain-containing protein [bacterium]|nr:HDOD domain-containing protein [bacterium]
MMNSADVFAQIEKMGDLPSLPQTLLQIQTVAEDQNSCADDLAQCILKDQALTMRVLKVVNSAMYKRAGGEDVRTVRRAVVVIGFETVRKLALGLSVFDMMSKLSRSPFLAEIARHSLITAGFAQILAEAGGKVSPEEAFVSALVHDIGKVVLLECSPEAMDAVVKDVRAGALPLEAERRHFGITHDRAGRRLAEQWNLPRDLHAVIGDHHDIDPLFPPRNLEPRLGVLAFANAMSRFTCQPQEQTQEYRIIRRAGKALGIPAARLESIYREVGDRISDLAERVGIDLGDLQDYGRIVNVKGSVNVAPKRMTPEEVARRTADQLDLYRRVGAGLATGRDSSDLLGIIMEGAVHILGFERVVLLGVDRKARRFTPLAWAGIEAGDLAERMAFPVTRQTGAVALALMEHRSIHVPKAASPAYGGLVGEELMAAARCTGFAVAPVLGPGGSHGVLYADCGAGGDDVVAEQATELAGLAQQAGLVLGAAEPVPI